MKKFSALSRMIALVVVVCLCATFIPMMTLAEPTDPYYYNGEDATLNWLTAEGVLNINSAADLRAFADTLKGGNTLAGRTVSLNVDIVWNNGTAEEIAANANSHTWESGSFAGTFLGNGHTISGLYRKNTSGYHLSFLGNAPDGATVTVKDLTLKNCHFNGGTYTSGLVSFVGKNATANINNVTVDGAYVKGTNVAGGLISQVAAGSTVTIGGSSFNGTVTANDHRNGTGGFIGVIMGGSLTIRNSSVNASVSGTRSSSDMVGGFVGQSRANTTIENVKFTGSVSGIKQVGGLVGFTNSALTIQNSVVDGSVTGTNYHIGGVVGYVDNASPSATVTNCLNLAAVTGLGSPAGIVGSAYEANTVVSNCINLGIVKNTNGDFVGGIVGLHKGASKDTIFNNISATESCARTFNNDAGENNEEVESANTLKADAEIRTLSTGALAQLGLTGWVSGTIDEKTMPLPASLNEMLNPPADGDDIGGGSGSEGSGSEGSGSEGSGSEGSGSEGSGSEGSGSEGSGSEGSGSEGSGSEGSGSEGSGSEGSGSEGSGSEGSGSEGSGSEGSGSEEKKPNVTPSEDASVYNGTPNGTWAADADGKWYIRSAADLAQFAAMVTAGTNFSGKTVVLTTDIIWNQGNASDWATTAPQYSWVAGDWGHVFAGTFDGQGHVISGLYSSGLAENVGFISTIQNGTVKNLAITNSYFSGGRMVGSILGMVKSGQGVIENVYSDAIVRGNTEAGGLVGRCHHDSTLIVNNSVFAGTVTSNSQAGGIVGSFQNANGIISITDCLNLGTVTATTANTGVAGGIFGGDKGKSLTIKNCINLGTVTGGKVGEIYGSSSAATKEITGNIYDSTKAISGDAATIDGNTAMTVAEIKAMTTQVLTDKGMTNWASGTLGESKLPLPTAIDKMLNPDAYAGGSGSGNTGSGDTGSEEEQPDDRPTVDTSKEASVYDGTISEKLRTEGRKVYIDSAADLALFAKSVCEGNVYPGKTVYLTTDIIWNEGKASEWATNAPKYSWVCGDWAHAFAGTFDGQGHVISGLYSSGLAENVGFISAVQSATVKNLVITNSYFSGGRMVGSILGMVKSGKATVDNVYSNAIVTANTEAGGLVGRCHDASTMNIKNSVFAGSVTSNTQAGGIMGSFQNANGTINITDCLNLGTVTASTPSTGVAGGIFGGNAGKSLTIKNCINLGTVTGAKVGEIYGSSSAATKEITGNLYDSAKAISGDTEVIEGNINDKTAEQIKAMSTTELAAKGFATWTAMKDGYPMPSGIHEIIYGASSAPEGNNPSTSDFVPVIFVTFAVLSAGAALTVLRKKKVQ